MKKRGRKGEIGPLAYIDSLEWEWKRHPVIRIDISAGSNGEGKAALSALLQNKLDNVAGGYEMAIREQTPPMQFENLILDRSELRQKEAEHREVGDGINT